MRQAIQDGVADVATLKGMPLKQLWLRGAPVKDLGVLEGMLLEDLTFDPRPGLDLRVVRSPKALRTINGQTPPDFWRKHGGE